MTAITPLKIPITVNTSQVAPAMKSVEKTVADSAQRISRIRGAITPALGALGMGQGASVLGGLTQFGGVGGAAAAGAGALIGGAMLPNKIAEKYFAAMAQSSEGASEALKQYNATGRQTFAANSALLREYAAMEERAKAMNAASDKTTFTGNLLSAAARGRSSSWIDQEMMVIREGTKGIGAFLGAILGGGSVREAMLAEQLTGTTSEAEAQRIRTEQAKARQSGEYSPLMGVAAIQFLKGIYDKL